MCERVAGASPLLFEARLKPGCTKLEDVLRLNAVDVPSQISDEGIKGGHWARSEVFERVDF